MRRVGESVYYKELLKPQLNEIVGENSYKMEHIIGRRKLVTHTDRVDDTQLEAVTALLERVLPKNIEIAQYNHHIEVDWREINKYVRCAHPSDMSLVNPNYKTDLTNDGEWAYPLTSLRSGWYAFPSTEMTKFKLKLPSLTEASNMFNGSKLSLIETELPKLTNAGFMCAHCGLKKWNIAMPKVNNGHGTLRGLGDLDLDLTLPVLSNGRGILFGTYVSKAAALKLINSIPEWTDDVVHEFGIGINIDYQGDEEIAEAVAAAEARGWSMTVQWGGTSSAQATTTYGLRKLPIYACVDEIDMPDGTTRRVLDWGHYVTNPEDYQEFSSLEEAREYFGISEDSEELNNSEQ